MFLNNLKLSLRHLWRQKLFTVLNVTGLAIGIATCLVILLFIHSELSYDRFHEKADRIVRVVFKGSVQGEKMNEAHVMPPVAEVLMEEFPEVEKATRIRLMGYPKIGVDERYFRNKTAAFVDANILEVFTLPLIKGDPNTALTEPNSIVISESAAKTFFDQENPLGKELSMNEGKDRFIITGVMADIPVNSHFHFDLLASMSTYSEAKDPSWMVSEFYTYLLLPAGYDYRSLESKLPVIVEKYMGPQIKQAMGIGFDEFLNAGNNLGIFLQPLTSIHLHSDMMGELSPGGDIRYVYIFGVIALFMLLIASINFMNLATASAGKRAKEVGVRKVLGSNQRQMIWQFLIESILLSLIALGMAMVMVKLVLPLFQNLSGESMVINYLSPTWLLPSLLLFGLVVGLLAGSYPAFFLSSFKTVLVLKGSVLHNSSKKTDSFRSGLVIFQFAVSLILITGTLVVYNQLEFIQNKDLGYEKDHLLIFPDTWLLGDHVATFKQQLLQDSRVKNVSISGYLPSGPSNNNNFFVFPEGDVSKQLKTLRYEVDDQYLPTLGLELVAGRNFSEEYGMDDKAIILNQTLLNALGWGEDALGKTLSRADNTGQIVDFTVIGIVKDFHFRSFHEHISPLVITYGNNSGPMIVSIQTDDMMGLIEDIKPMWTAHAGDEPFDYSFMDERVYQTYAAERKVGYILTVFSLLTIFVACMGLFGLATFTAKQRTKEIGIRKVLGADVGNIVGLLSTDFLKLILIAIVLSTPVSWFVMNQWLEGFAYQVPLYWWVFILAGLIAIIVALFTISFQSIKAALMNPVKSLRSD